MRNDPPSTYNTSLTGQFLWQVSRSREWAHPVGKVIFNSTEDGGCCCGVVGWTNAKAGAAAAARKQVVEGEMTKELHRMRLRRNLQSCEDTL